MIDLSDAQIALLCDIGEHELPTLTGEQGRDVERLLSWGYVRPTEAEPGSGFKLTSKGFAFLDDRGVGLNEG